MTGTLEVFARIDLRHGVCGYVQQRAEASGVEPYVAQALCGARVTLPLGQPVGQPKCQRCVDASVQHSQVCDCFRLWSKDAQHPGRRTL